jgi:hypothetical protein
MVYAATLPQQPTAYRQQLFSCISNLVYFVSLRSVVKEVIWRDSTTPRPATVSVAKIKVTTEGNV